MTPKERMLTALSLQEPDDFCPVWEIEFHLFNKVSSRQLIVSEEYTQLTAKEKERALHANAEIMVEVAKELGLSALSNIGPYWERAPGVPGVPIWLPPKDSKRFLPILRQAAGDEIFIIEWCSAMTLCQERDDIVEFSYKLFDAPDEIESMAQKQLRNGLEIARRARDTGADGLVAPCDIATSTDMFFNPAQIKRFLLPYLQSWAQEVRKLGMKSIFHSDGNIMEVLDKLADITELDALQAIDPTAGMDIVEVKKQVADRLCLCGNIDLRLLQHGPVESIRDEVKRVCLSCKTGGGFVLGATNAVFKEIPVMHYQAMLEAGREFGKYPNQGQEKSKEGENYES